jgi:WD40 repeat protein/GTPase SAR1 family protein
MRNHRNQNGNNTSIVAGGLVISILIFNLLLNFLPDYLPASFQSVLNTVALPASGVLILLIVVFWTWQQTYTWLETRKAVRFDPMAYVQRFLEQYTNPALRDTQHPVVDPLFRDNLHQKFIPLTYVSETGESGGNLRSFVDQWIQAGRTQNLVILGDYGSGKTSFCLSLMYDLLLMYKQHPEKSVLPLYFSFRDIVPHRAVTPPEQRMLEILTDRYGIKTGDVEDIAAFVRAHTVLLILDGFDEVSDTLELVEAHNHLSSLGQVMRDAGGAIITCRANYFGSSHDLKRVFPLSSHIHGALGSFTGAHGYRVVSLQGFSTADQQAYLEKVVSDSQQRLAIWQRIKAMYDLSDLARRPILLRFIVDSAARIARHDHHRITATVLYREYVTEWFYQQQERLHGRSVPIQDQQEVLERLAVQLFEHNQELISRDDLNGFLREQIRAHNLTAQLNLAQFEYAFATCTFLTRHKDDHFGFIHRSFLEFFVAEALLSEIRRCQPEHFGQRRLLGMVKIFLAELITYKNEHTPGLQADAEMCLKSWIEQSRQLGHTAPYLAGNSVALLCQLDVPLHGFDMSRITLKDADLTGGNFRNSILREANLDGSILTGVDFSDSDMECANLSNTFLNDTIFRRVNLRQASLGNIRMIGGPNTVWKACFSPDRNWIVTGTDRGNMLIHPFRADTTVQPIQMSVSDAGVLHFTFSPDGTLLAVSDRELHIYVYLWEHVLAGHATPQQVYLGGDDYVRWLDFSPDGSILASGGRDHMVKLWYQTGHRNVHDLTFHTGPVMCVCWSPDGHALASAGYDHHICIWQIQEHENKRIILCDSDMPTAHTGIVRALAFNQTGTRLASGGEDQLVKLWDVSSTINRPVLRASQRVANDVFCLVFIENDTTLLVGGADGFIRRLDVETCTVTHEIKAHDNMIRSLSVDELAGYVLTASWDGTAKLWQLADLSFVEQVLSLDQFDVQYGTPDAFAGACINGIRDLPDVFQQYLYKLGAINNC